MFQHKRALLGGVTRPVCFGFAILVLGACAAPMSAEEVEQRMAQRDARCQELKAQIDAAGDNPLRRDYLLRQYDRECRRP